MKYEDPNQSVWKMGYQNVSLKEEKQSAIVNVFTSFDLITQTKLAKDK